MVLNSDKTVTVFSLTSAKYIVVKSYSKASFSCFFHQCCDQSCDIDIVKANANSFTALDLHTSIFIFSESNILTTILFSVEIRLG